MKSIETIEITKVHGARFALAIQANRLQVTVETTNGPRVLSIAEADVYELVATATAYLTSRDFPWLEMLKKRK